MINSKRNAIVLALLLTFILLMAPTVMAADLTVIYFEKDGQTVKADYETASATGGPMFAALRTSYTNAIINGPSLYLELADGKVVNWLENLNGDVPKPWSLVTSLPSVAKPLATLELNTSGVVAPVAAAISFTKATIQDPVAGTVVTVTIAAADAQRVTGVTVKSVAASRLPNTTDKWRAVLPANTTVTDADVVCSTSTDNTTGGDFVVVSIE